MPNLYTGHHPASGSSGSVTITPATESNGTVEVEADTSDYSIAAGKLRVRVTNRGPENGGSLSIATVNGNDLPVGETVEFVAIHNTATNQFITTPAIAIVTNGAYVTAAVYDD